MSKVTFILQESFVLSRQSDLLEENAVGFIVLVSGRHAHGPVNTDVRALVKVWRWQPLGSLMYTSRSYQECRVGLWFSWTKFTQMRFWFTSPAVKPNRSTVHEAKWMNLYTQRLMVMCVWPQILTWAGVLWGETTRPCGTGECRLCSGPGWENTNFINIIQFYETFDTQTCLTALWI